MASCASVERHVPPLSSLRREEKEEARARWSHSPHVEAVRELVESVVGEYSENEYFEMEVDGLPAS